MNNYLTSRESFGFVDDLLTLAAFLQLDRHHLEAGGRPLNMTYRFRKMLSYQHQLLFTVLLRPSVD